MADDYYEDGGSEGQPAEVGKPDSDHGQTCLVPKSLFGGKDVEPGMKCDIEVVAVHGDEVQVKGCGYGEKPEAPEEGGEKAPVPSGMESMLQD